MDGVVFTELIAPTAQRVAPALELARRSLSRLGLVERPDVSAQIPARSASEGRPGSVPLLALRAGMGLVVKTRLNGDPAWPPTPHTASIPISSAGRSRFRPPKKSRWRSTWPNRRRKSSCFARPMDQCGDCSKRWTPGSRACFVSADGRWIFSVCWPGPSHADHPRQLPR